MPGRRGDPAFGADAAPFAFRARVRPALLLKGPSPLGEIVFQEEWNG